MSLYIHHVGANMKTAASQPRPRSYRTQSEGLTAETCIKA